MDREQLVEKMTESAAQGLHEAIFGVGVWQRILPGERAQWCGYVRAAMRAALAVAEPVIRNDCAGQCAISASASRTIGKARGDLCMERTATAFDAQAEIMRQGTNTGGTP